MNLLRETYQYLVYGIWYNPNTNIYVNDITEKFFAKKQPLNDILYIPSS
jgi:hypothetical protein